MALTAISFVFWGVNTSRLGNGNGAGGSDNYGMIYGHKITPQAFYDAKNEFDLLYWFRSGGEWPERNPNFSEIELEREIYIRLMLMQKANDLGIHIGDNEAATAASEMLRSIGRNGQPLPLEEFLKQVLQPKGLTVQDFQNFARQYLIMEQLQQAIGLTGEFITPQQAVAAYQRDRQELSAQAVFFSASNYLSQVTVTPALLTQFYTNHLADYRLPDRVQVSYVAFEMSNYLASAEQKIGRTNLDGQVDALYRRYGVQGVQGAKTPEEAKTRIRTTLIRQQAITDVRQAANDFANEVSGKEPARPENLAAAAKEKGLAVHVTAPFAAKFGPDEFAAPPAFIKAAFGLTPDEPFAGPVPGPEAMYVLAFGKQLPTEIPALDQIRDRVTQDYQWVQAVYLTWHAGSDFARTLTGTNAVGRGFASQCTAAGFQPQILPPFSLRGTQELPGFNDRSELDQLKQAAFTLPIGKVSGFVTNNGGGFIVYVQSRLPVDQTKMNSDLREYTATLRRDRLNEAFNQWVSLEANRQLRNTPVFWRQQSAPGTQTKT